MTPTERKEMIARIIEPNAFDDIEREREWCARHNKPFAEWARGHIDRCNMAMAKADEILSRLAAEPAAGVIEALERLADDYDKKALSAQFADRSLIYASNAKDIRAIAALSKHRSGE